MNKYLKKFIAFVLVGAMTLSMGISSVAATTKEETQDRIDQLEQEKESLQNKIDALKSSKTSTEDYITELDQQMTDVSTQIQSLNEQLDTLEAQIDETQASLDAAKQKESEQYEVLKLRIKTMYEKGETSFIDIIFGAQDIATILNSAEYIAQISDFDNRLLQSLEESRIQIAAYEEQLASEKTDLETTKTELEGKQEEISTLTDAKKEELTGLSESIDSTQGDLDDVEEDLANENNILASIAAAEAQAKANYEALKNSMTSSNSDAQTAASEAAKIAKEQQAAAEAAAAEAAAKQAEADRLAAEAAAKAEADKAAAEKAAKEAEAAAAAAAAKAEADRLAAEKAQQEAEAKKNEAASSSNSSSSLATGSGSFTWPLPGYTTISSNFGARQCPFHGTEYHNGVDIPAAGGTPVHAADGGVVVQAAYDSSLGNYVVINHGNGYNTWYLHNSSLAVRVGQSVSKGQVISYVGTTGSSTGNHLDFRIKLDNGGYVNPLSYCTPY